MKGTARIGNKLKSFAVGKRQKFVLGVILLSLGLFFAENAFGKSGILFIVFLSILTDFFLFWALRQDIKSKSLASVFILPFIYSFSFGLFYLLAPSRFISKIVLTSFYAFGLYSLFLSQNILVVGTLKTIALLGSARTVSFIIALVSYFFLSNIILSLDFSLIPTGILLFASSFFLVLHSIWIQTLEKITRYQLLWIVALSSCLFEVSLILWFWPSPPTFIAIFLSGFFYTLVSLSHVWLEKRLFRGVLWEHIWVSVIVFCILLLFTSWRS